MDSSPQEPEDAPLPVRRQVFMKLESRWPWVVVALYGTAVAGSCLSAAMSEWTPDPLEAVWWWIAVPTVFYVAPTLHVAGLLDGGSSSTLRAFLEPMAPAAAVALALAIAWSWVAVASDIVFFGDEDYCCLFMPLLLLFQPGIPCGWRVLDGTMLVLVLLLDSCLACSICLNKGLRSTPWPGAAFSCIVCLSVVPAANLAIALACVIVNPILPPLPPAFYGLRSWVILWYSAMVVGERAVVPGVLLWHSIVRPPVRHDRDIA